MDDEDRGLGALGEQDKALLVEYSVDVGAEDDGIARRLDHVHVRTSSFGVSGHAVLVEPSAFRLRNQMCVFGAFDVGCDAAGPVAHGEHRRRIVRSRPAVGRRRCNGGGCAVPRGREITVRKAPVGKGRHERLLVWRSERRGCRHWSGI